MNARQAYEKMIFERKKITLYEPISHSREVRYLTKNLEYPRFEEKRLGYNVEDRSKIIPNGRTLEIYADDFSLVEGE